MHKFVIEWFHVIQRKGVLNNESGQVKKMRRRFLAAALGMSMAVAMTPAAAFAEETSTEEATEAETGAEEESSEAETEAFDYSEGYDEKGFFEGIKALDYVTLPEYSSIELPTTVAPSDDDVQAQIDNTLNSYSTKNQITDEDRLIEDGDTVNIDYVGSIDGVEFEGGSTEGNGTTVTIGVTNYIDGFLDQLIGHAPGENFDINVTFPDDYSNEDVKGKDAVFNITINYIEETVVPELDDDFVAENLADYESADDYRQSVYDSLYKQNLFNALSEYLVNNSEFSEIPDAVADTIYNERYERYSYYAQMYGIDMDTFLAANGLDEDSFRDMWGDYTKACLTYQAVMEDTGWEMSVDDAKEQLGFDDDHYNDAVTNFGEPYVLAVAMQSYVLDKLGDNVTLVEVEEESSEEASSEAVSEEESSEEVSTEEASSEAE